MAFPNLVYLQPGDQFKNRTNTQGPLYLPGTVGVMPNGDRFRYVQCDHSTAVVVGKLYQGPVPVTNHVLQTAAAAAVGADNIALTIGNTAISANDYLAGTVVIDLVGNTGFGYIYHIDAHPAVLASGVFTIPLAGSSKTQVQSDGLRLSGYETVQVAVATTSSSVSVYPNLGKHVILVPSTNPTAAIVGASPRAMAIDTWGWMQCTGEAMVLTDNTSVVTGEPAISSTVTAGAVSLITTSNVVTSPIVGTFVRIAASASYSTVNLCLP